MMQLRRWRPRRSSVSGVTVSLAASWDTAMMRAGVRGTAPPFPRRATAAQTAPVVGRCSAMQCICGCRCRCRCRCNVLAPAMDEELCFWRQLRFCKSALWFIYELLGTCSACQTLNSRARTSRLAAMFSHTAKLTEWQSPDMSVQPWCARHEHEHEHEHERVARGPTAGRWVPQLGSARQPVNPHPSSLPES